jgi:hypothetical protein
VAAPGPGGIRRRIPFAGRQHKPNPPFGIGRLRLDLKIPLGYGPLSDIADAAP